MVDMLVEILISRIQKGTRRGFCGIGFPGTEKINKNGAEGNIVLKLNINTDEELQRWSSFNHML